MSNALRDFALKMCPHVCVISRGSVKKHFGSQADSFDYDMAAYCALGFLLTYVFAYRPDESTSDQITMDVLDWADAENVQREGVAVTHARLKINFEDSGSIDSLSSDILEDMVHISPEHNDVYAEILDDIDYKFVNLYKP